MADHNAENAPAYSSGDVAVVEGRTAVYMPTRWEWMDGTWTAIALDVGPVLFNVHAVAEAIGGTRKRPKHRYPCPTSDCPGDARYMPPGKGHLSGCRGVFQPSTPPGTLTSHPVEATP